MSDRRVAMLRRLAASTTFDGERDAALAKAAELEARAAPPAPPGPPRPPVAGSADWGEPQWFGVQPNMSTSQATFTIQWQVVVMSTSP